tara:strand:- start:270 stop:743 length:474 start_codon:yes stop_codon:yes gene_type:complete
MHPKLNKLRLSTYAVFTLGALLIFVDFVSPGRRINDKIINLKKERQQYFNAARNYHYSYKISTNEHEFIVAEDFIEPKLINKKIQYSISRIFKEVNWYKLLSSQKRSFSSLRVVSGCLVPLLLIIAIFVAYKYKKKIGLLIFILQVLLLADFIFLIL